ncbi:MULTISPECIES: hypothetical protein [Thalassotalea]|uniref:hypothetical protein n=1 Tax=Thalassotalea TaxID=1518149 RepID=UPI00094470E6|nr:MULTISPECIES: hypothetical protein [Thalassotalea]OKY24827.1 hypothetical protein BI291_04500 [Thalassotalea sp. PP2-459]
MKHRLSFGQFNLLSNNIVEVVVDEGIVMDLEMVDECHHFIQSRFCNNFAMLINKVNHYTYSYEAKLSVASYAHLKAIAFVYYSKEAQQISNNLQALRAIDKWNCRVFSGLELGWQQAYNWLQSELQTVKIKVE